jgi:hypothetical protein
VASRPRLWFFETFLLKPYAPGYRSFHPRFEYLFNSYYETVGSFHPRARRGVLARPTVEEIYRYRAHVDEAMLTLMHSVSSERWDDVASRVILGLNHEQQHQELLLMDIKKLRGESLRRLPGRPATAMVAKPIAPLRWIERPAAAKSVMPEGFAFDSETPRHDVLLRDPPSRRGQ